MGNRIQWIDTAKGLGLLLVFIGHMHPVYISTWIYTCHMPLFFFLSGFVFTLHPWRTFIHKKISRLVIPYFFLGLVIYLFYAAIYIYQHREIQDYMLLLRNLLEQKAFWTIWFLAALFCGEIILWIILKMCKLHLLYAFILSVCIMSGAFVYYRNGGSTLYWCFDVGCVSQFFILLGYILKRNYADVKSYISRCNRTLLLTVLFAVNLLSGFACIRLSHSQLDMSVGLYGNEILTLISAMSGIGALILLCQMVSNRFLRYLGENTMIFFAWHSRIILVACGMVYGALGLFQSSDILNQYLYCVVSLIVILAVLYPVTEGIKKTKFRHLFGV